MPPGTCSLALCGHLHGGQICLPAPSGKVRLSHRSYRFNEGVFEEPDVTVVVSRGLGTTLVPFRVFARPEVSLLRLRPRAGVRARHGRPYTRFMTDPTAAGAAESVHSPGVSAHISHAVIAAYAAAAAREVTGVHALTGGHLGRLERRGDPDRLGVRVAAAGEAVDLELHVITEWGASIPAVAGASSGRCAPIWPR